MRINNNMMAMNTHRQLGISTNGGAKSMEKLSSGSRINRAGDDAAGLAISEKMRGQIRGLNQASSNAQDGISLIQTTEGALNETHAILQRMRELAVQSSTDTNTDKDRTNLQDEIDQLAAEVTRIAETTQFNTMNLLDGSFEGKKFHIGANSEQNVTIDVNDMTSKALGIESAGKFVEKTGESVGDVDEVESKNSAVKELVFTNGDETGGKIEVELKDGKLNIKADEDATLVNINKALEEYDVKIAASGGGLVVGGQGTIKLEAKTQDFGAITDAVVNVSDKSIKSLTFDTGTVGTVEVTKDTAGAVVVKAGADVTLDELNVALKDYGISVKSTDVAITGDTEVGTFAAANDIVDLDAVSSAIKIDTQKSADKAITTINDALENVSKERSKLGAIQNRLEHTIKNLDTSSENLQASEARIRDVDMAKEMMEQTKQNILQQASTAMLANANQQPETVLQLLR